jgi:TPR repeat protein
MMKTRSLKSTRIAVASSVLICATSLSAYAEGIAKEFGKSMKPGAMLSNLTDITVVKPVTGEEAVRYVLTGGTVVFNKKLNPSTSSFTINEMGDLVISSENSVDIILEGFEDWAKTKDFSVYIADSNKTTAQELLSKISENTGDIEPAAGPEEEDYGIPENEADEIDTVDELEIEEVESVQEVTTVDGYLEAAADGNVDAMYNLGLIYSTGEEGVEVDYQEAFKWYKLAAEAGDHDAQLNLGILYSNGLGVAQNYTEALNWYLKSANQGNSIAQYNLGVIFSQGKGMEVDYQEAVKWYTQAAAQGDATAKYNLGIIYFQGVPGVIQKDIPTAFKWISEAADTGDEDALYMLSQPVFNTFTARWYRKKAETGDVEAQVKIASYYLWGRGIDKDIVRAHMWFNIASAEGSEEALENRRAIEESMTLEQIEQAQKLAKEWHASRVLQNIIDGAAKGTKSTTPVDSLGEY